MRMSSNKSMLPAAAPVCSLRHTRERAERCRVEGKSATELRRVTLVGIELRTVVTQLQHKEGANTLQSRKILATISVTENAVVAGP